MARIDDKTLLKRQIADAEAFYAYQKKRAFEEGVIDHKLIALAMGNLNELHAKACALGYRDLLNEDTA